MSYKCYVLYLKEIKRFFRVYHQTIIAPVISSLVFFLIFVLALRDANYKINGLMFANFIGYGLIIMTIVQNAFANSSSSMIMSKVIGYVTDLIIPPLSAFDVVLAYAFGAITRGIITGLAFSIVLLFFIDFSIHCFGIVLFFAVFGSLLMGLLGILSGLYADTFDQNAIITNYIINPLSFLSGTFYSIDKLPKFLQLVNYMNPLFYIIDGFRYGFTGVSHVNIIYSAIFLLIVNLLTFLLLIRLYNMGWKIKS